MKISASIKRTQQLQQKLARVGDRMTKAAEDQLITSILAVHATAVKSIQAHESSYKTEHRSNPARTVNVSAPGYPPNSDTGRLAQSIAWEIDADRLRGRVGTNLKYGAWLEFGTKDIAPRPWLFPALVANTRDVLRGFTVSLKDSLRAA